MIMYTPVPLELIFDGIEDQVEACTEITVDGILMQVQQVNSYEARIVRMISPNPQHYLNPAYAPGQMIRFTPTLK